MIDRSLLRGSIPPLVTPFRDGAVDYAAFARLVEFQVTSGSHGILVNGTTAEPAMLSLDERNRLVEVAVETAARRIPVLVNTGSQSLAETQSLTDYAAQAGADALLIVTPYYSKPPQRGLVRYYLEVTARLTIPWLIYHIPGRTAVGVTLETVVELARASPTFVGMKHAVNDLGFVSETLARLPQFRIFVGLEELSFPMLAIGAVGLMNAVGNLHPRSLARMCDLVDGGDLHAARELHQQLLELNQAVFFDTNPIPLKYMMRRIGLLETNEHRLPMVPASAALERRLDEVLERSQLFSGVP